MIIRNLSRRKMVATLLGTTFFATLAVGSGPQVVTVTKIVDQVSTVITILELVDRASDLTLASVDTAYQDLGDYLRDNNFTTDVVISMEERYSELDSRFSELKSNLSKASSEASNLFSLLKSKANENTNPEFKQIMMSRITEKEGNFSQEIANADQVLSKIGQSIQQYKDILGFAQVTVVLDEVDRYIGQVKTVLAESDILSADIEQAIEDATVIINSSRVLADSSQSPAPSTPQSNSSNWEFPKSACGDANPPGIQNFYPVFVSPANQETLDYVKRTYCGDAFVKRRENLNEDFIQVASFQTKEKASQLANILLSDPKVGKAEIGAPSQF